MRKKLFLMLVTVVLIMTMAPAVTLAEEPMETEEEVFIQACWDVGGVSVWQGRYAFCAPAAIMMPALQPAPAAPAAEPSGVVTGEDVTINGVPGQVDPAVVDKSDHDVFTHEIGLGSEMILGEPGKLNVGPEWTGEVGTTTRFWTDSQEIFESDGPAYYNCPEGGFCYFSMAAGDIQISEIALHLPGRQGHNYLVFIRGRNADGAQDSDLNIRVKFTNYVAGHAYAARYSENPPGGFVSEGQFMQLAAMSHTSGTNCGAEGCSKLTAVFLDVNTGAYSVLFQNGLNGPWEHVASNWSQ